MATAQLGFGFEDFTHLFAIQDGHHHIEEDQVTFLAAQYLQSFNAMTGRFDVIPFEAQNIDHHIANNWVIIYDQDLTRFDMLSHPAYPCSSQWGHPCAANKN